MLVGIEEFVLKWINTDFIAQRAVDCRASGLTKLEGDQLRELGRDVCHRLFCSAQAAP